MQADDFEKLFVTSMNWSGVDWESQDGRFEPLPDYRRFARAYWFENYVDLIIARSFLIAAGFESSTHFDAAEGYGSHLLLTDFGGAI
jgi:hypothetical protein